MIEKLGQHRVRVGSVLDGVDDLVGGDDVSVVYTDPPWGPGALSYFETLTASHVGAKKASVEFDAFMEALYVVFDKYASRLLILEYGIKWRSRVVGAMRARGFAHLGTFTRYYSGGSKKLPMDVNLFSREGLRPPEGYQDTFLNEPPAAAMKAILAPFAVEGGVLLDPCCGTGYMASAAIHHGMRFLGNEISPKRLEDTKRRLRRGR